MHKRYEVSVPFSLDVNGVKEWHNALCVDVFTSCDAVEGDASWLDVYVMANGRDEYERLFTVEFPEEGAVVAQYIFAVCVERLKAEGGNRLSEFLELLKADADRYGFDEPVPTYLYIENMRVLEAMAMNGLN